MTAGGRAHPFEEQPHRTLLAWSLPVLIGFLAGPITDLVDTGFSAALGASSQAALGIGALVFMTVHWVFNFLGIAAQTEVAHARGAGDPVRAREAATLALAWSLAAGAVLGVLGFLASEPLAALLQARGAVLEEAVLYLRIRWISLPAILTTATAAGILRGAADMAGPMRVSIGLNALNVLGDALLVRGAGPLPGLGIAGLAWATVAAQIAGAVWSLALVRDRIGTSARVPWGGSAGLLRIGRDQFLRTFLLMAFFWTATGAANRMGEAAGAAWQGIRTFWLTAALLLDAFGVTAQTLVGTFLGAGRPRMARRVAAVACLHGLGVGFLLLGLMLLLEDPVRRLLVAPEAWPLFPEGWRLAAWMQPLAALCFVTDGLHWGSRDFAWLRNAMLAASGVGGAALLALDAEAPDAFARLWETVVLWLAVRAFFGLVRIWPGLGGAPLRPEGD